MRTSNIDKFINKLTQIEKEYLLGKVKDRLLTGISDKVLESDVE